MYLQSVVFNSDKADTEELFLRISGDVHCEGESLIMSPGSIISTFTYMNHFDAGFFKSVTGINSCDLVIEYKGEADFRMICVTCGDETADKEENGGRCVEKKETVICEKRLKSPELKSFRFRFEPETGDKIYYFTLNAVTDLTVNNSFYEASEDYRQYKDIRIALLITTFDGTKNLVRNIKVLKDSAFFSRDVHESLHHLYGRLDIYIVDNKSRLPLKDEEHIKIFHNNNTGGTGGFTRGVRELRKRAEEYGNTHVIFMDDDVELEAECLYRLFALLSCVKQEYTANPVAGRMFDADAPTIQYTACEVWDKGYVRHLGHNADMRDENAFVMPDGIEPIEGHGVSDIYGGWWFCCYPYSFVKENTPLPFFLHCDDVEYGIRCGLPPLVLNGVHVCHDIPEKKVSQILAYYDARNAMIINAVYGLASPEEILAQWRNRLAAFRDKGDLDSINMTIIAILHFLKGPDWFMNVDGEMLHKRLRKKDFTELKLFGIIGRISYKAAWRSVDAFAVMKIKQVIQKYTCLLDTKILSNSHEAYSARKN